MAMARATRALYTDPRRGHGRRAKLRGVRPKVGPRVSRERSNQPTARKTIAVFCASGSREGDPNYRDAEEVGRLLAGAGFRIFTGGYQGSMEAVSRGAHEIGAETVGLTTEEYRDYTPNRYLRRVIHHPHIYSRLRRFLTEADGFIVLRGGLGTLTELFLTWSLSQSGVLGKKPLVLLGRFWDRFFELFREELIVAEKDYHLVYRVLTPAQAVDTLKRVLLNGRVQRRAVA